MILYTPIPYEMIFPEDEECFSKQQTIEFDGGLLVVEHISQTEYKIIRLISSEPSHYLNENCSPGNVVQLKPQLNM